MIKFIRHDRIYHHRRITRKQPEILNVNGKDVTVECGEITNHEHLDAIEYNAVTAYIVNYWTANKSETRLKVRGVKP